MDATSRSTSSPGASKGLGTKEGNVHTRLTINLNPEAAAALKSYTDKRHISYTEAIRRAIAILKFVDDEVSAGREVQVTDGQTIQKIVLVS